MKLKPFKLKGSVEFPKNTPKSTIILAKHVTLRSMTEHFLRPWWDEQYGESEKGFKRADMRWCLMDLRQRWNRFVQEVKFRHCSCGVYSKDESTDVLYVQVHGQYAESLEELDWRIMDKEVGE